jgi:hypothetical protein
MKSKKNKIIPKKYNERTPPIVEVIWEDSWANNNYNYTDEAFKAEGPLILHNVGYLIQNDKRGVGLALERNVKATNSRNVSFIPRMLIKKMCKIRR